MGLKNIFLTLQKVGPIADFRSREGSVLCYLSVEVNLRGAGNGDDNSRVGLGRSWKVIVCLRQDICNVLGCCPYV